MKNALLILFSCFTTFSYFNLRAQTQPNLGLVYRSQEASLGYTLFTPEANNYVYLIDNCGQVVNQWTFGENPGATCYLLENGNLLRAGKDTIQIKDWDDNLLWSFALNAKLGLNQHHDIEALPNGNVLCVIADDYPKEDLVPLGFDTISNPSSTIKLDKIIELKPWGMDSAEVVWEWKFIDHLIQNFDSTKLNYGIVGDHPELVDINFENDYINDFTHFNAIDYNANLDQILFSVRSLHEIMIIDHSTTTAEAASHLGGNSNQGGDILWRWGNPMVYDQGSIADKKLGAQHDCKWIKEGYLDEGKITVFNNLTSNTTNFMSAIVMLNPSIANGVYQKMNNRFLPEDYAWSWSGTLLGDTLFENKKSGTHALANGNFIIAETSKGKISEIDRDGNLLWSYINPSGQDTIFQQDEEIIASSNRIFRAEKYPYDFEGFINKDLSQQGSIENQNSLTDSCELIIPTRIHELNAKKNIFINPSKNGLLEFIHLEQISSLKILNLEGKTVFELHDIETKLIGMDLNPGIYFLELSRAKLVTNHKLVVQ
ncbi:MAG: aryl-sulfate sulfotransferase [Chitinophagales bacterium]